MNRKPAAAIALCSVMLAGASAPQSGQGGVSNREVAAAVPTEFKAIFERGFSTGTDAEVWAGFPYDRIDIERTACFGTCPIYSMSLYRGGRAVWQGVRYTERDGGYEGKVNIVDYGKLCYLMKKTGFDLLAPRYTAGWTDSPTTIVKIVEDGRTKTVSDYSEVGPIELWTVQQAIDNVGDRIRWTRK